jgi:hypothetical protein
VKEGKVVDLSTYVEEKEVMIRSLQEQLSIKYQRIVHD